MEVSDDENVFFFDEKSGFIGDGLWNHECLSWKDGELLTDVEEEYVGDEFKVEGGEDPYGEQTNAVCEFFIGFGILNEVGEECFKDDAGRYGEEDVADDPHDELD